MTDRRAKLLSLLLENQHSEQTLFELRSFGWDSIEDLVIMERKHLKKVLHQFLEGAITTQEVYAWASALECREDVGFELGYEGFLQDVVFRLATSELEGELTADEAALLLEKLS